MPDEIKTQAILIPDNVKDAGVMLEQQVTVVECGPEAWREEGGQRAVPGDRVIITKYSGYMAMGPADGKRYKLVNDRDIFARVVDQGDDNG